MTDPRCGTSTEPKESLVHALSLRARVFAGVAALALLSSVGIAAAANSKPSYTRFSMSPQAAFLNCVKPYPISPAPTVTVKVKRGDLNDRATVELKGFKPNLDFDVFTIQHSPQTASGGRRSELGRRTGVVPVGSARRVGGFGSRADPHDPARPDLRPRQGRRARTDQHLPPRVLVQQPGRREELRLHRCDPVQR
jgi:hypothetical protein